MHRLSKKMTGGRRWTPLFGQPDGWGFLLISDPPCGAWISA